MKNMPSFRIARKSRNSRSLSITEMKLSVRKIREAEVQKKMPFMLIVVGEEEEKNNNNLQ
jgi:threonyl-tRNA synthetase